MTSALALLLLSSLVSQSWSAPKVNVFLCVPLVADVQTRQQSASVCVSHEGLLPAEELDPTGDAVPQGHSYVYTMITGQVIVVLEVLFKSLSF